MAKNIFLTLLVVFLIVSCSKNKHQFSLDGKIENASDSVLYLDKLTSNGIQLVDSTRTSGSGKFSFNQMAVKEPQFFFLRMRKSQSIPLLIDSNEMITINTTIDKFPESEIVGSKSSLLLQQVNTQMVKLRGSVEDLFVTYKKLTDEDAKNATLDQITSMVTTVKDSLGKVMLKNPHSFVSYYILYQKITKETMLYNPYNESDFKYFAAIATSLNVHYPDAIRTKALYKMVEDIIRQRRMAKMQELIDKAEYGLPEIALPDIKGDTIKLSAQKGKVIILNFWSLKSKSSPLLNNHFKKIYSQYKSKGLEIYQVSLDKSKILWEMTMEEGEFSWLSVCDFNGENLRAASRYNVTELPTTFIINRNGEVVKRVTDYRDIEKDIKALL